MPLLNNPDFIWGKTSHSRDIYCQNSISSLPQNKFTYGTGKPKWHQQSGWMRIVDSVCRVCYLWLICSTQQDTGYRYHLMAGYPACTGLLRELKCESIEVFRNQLTFNQLGKMFRYDGSNGFVYQYWYVLLITASKVHKSVTQFCLICAVLLKWSWLFF